MGNMFERFTDRARRVLVDAQDEARSLHHSFIAPEHILLGLIRGEGVAARSLAQLGVSLEEVRDKVAAAISPATKGERPAKVPFSPQAKKALELSLREALRLGHNYIGTEHILLGVVRGAEAGGSSCIEVLGVGAEEVRARVLEAVANGPAPIVRQSPALVEAMQRARQGAGPGLMTTGQLLLAMLADGTSQAAKALQALQVSVDAVEARLAEIPIGTTTDAPPRARSVHIRLGEVTTTIDDADLAAALGGLTPEQLATALRNALAADPGREASA